MAIKLNLTTAQSTVGHQREAVYNALDTIATLEIDNVLDGRMTDGDRRVHDFYMAIQGAAMEMTHRGMMVDEVERQALVSRLNKQKMGLDRGLSAHKVIKEVWDLSEKETGICLSSSRKDSKHTWSKLEEGQEEKDRVCTSCGHSRMKIKPFNAGSPDQVKHLLYDLLKMKKQFDKDHKVTSDKEALQKLAEKYPKHKDIVDALLERADVSKQLGFLKFNAPDGRFHAGFNVGVTSTHRWSSNSDQFGRGGNAQNITEKHRHIFTADPGYELVYADLKQAESNIIAHKAGDQEYINAHLVGDTHTYVCRLVWPEGINGQPWVWDDIKADKAIATSAAPPWDDKPGHDYRFQSKAVQHGSNLGLTAFGLAIQKRIPVKAAEEAQRRYFKAFPGIRAYQNFIRETVQNQEHIVTPLGVRFKLYGRPWDESTYKEGLAIIPQSTVGHIISIGVWRIWRHLPEVQLLAQIHDAILFQVPKGRYDLVYEALQLMNVAVPVVGVDGVLRNTVIETEAAVGRNWAHASEHNPDGVREITFTSPTEWSIHK